MSTETQRQKIDGHHIIVHDNFITTQNRIKTLGLTRSIY